MKRLAASLLAALCLFSVSCVREWEPDGALVERTWTVTLEPGTRATLDGELYPVWEVGERLSVYDPVVGTGRVFTVVSVNGRTAEISGRISEGDFPFDAIYPSKSAGAWNTDGTNQPKLPATQVIPAGRDICPDVLVATAHSEHPEAGITFRNRVSLLQFEIDREDIASVTVSLAAEDRTASFTAASGEGPLAKGAYYIAVDPGSYTKGVTLTCADGFGAEAVKASAAPLTAQEGGLLRLGIVSDGTPRRAYTVTRERSYANQQALIDATGVFNGLDELTASFAKTMLGIFFQDRNSVVRAFYITHLSADPQGKPVTLSACVFVPQAVLDGTKTLDGVAIANHGTIASNAECPTNTPGFEAVFAWKNYAIIFSDYYGFGASSSRPQAYLDPETTARGSLDAYATALQLLSDRGVSPGSKCYNIGYSQGGFNAVANLRYVSQHPELGVRFTQTFAGGSPFDLPITWSSYLAGGFGEAVGFVPLTLVSLNEAQQLGLDYAKMFKEPLLSNWREWILSKKYNLAAINVRLGTAGIGDLLTDAFVAGTSPEYATVMDVSRRFSLTSGWKPAAGSKVLIYHSTEDDLVPYANYPAMKAYLDAVAGDCDITWSSGANGGHVAAYVQFFLKVLPLWN